MADLAGSGGYKNFILPALALVVLGALYFAQKQVLTETPQPTPSEAQPTTKPVARGESAPAKPDAKAPEEPAAPAAAEERARRDAMLRRLQGSLARRGVPAQADAPAAEPATGAAPAPASPDAKQPAPPTPTLNKDYIRQRIKDDLVPLARECYESALEDDAALAGRLVMDFSIVGDEDIGGVVDEVALGEDSEIKHPELLECLRESMYSVTFEPPEGYGTVRVTYPIVFAQAPPDGE
ncbi:MAG: AgmX/PglI C-terminal domain-containing protein [Myxococcales bacterium]|nr:AgmX/PglI C-terminal domain-containing protein [Myxococcales bacterium]